MEKKPRKRANDLTGSEWLKNSFTIWRDIRRTKEEKQLKHPAMFPEMLAGKLIECYTKEINDSKKRSLILDPFCGIGTTVIAATQKNRNSIGIELSKEFVKISKKRLNDVQAQTTLDKSKKAKIKPTIINDRAENVLKNLSDALKKTSRALGSFKKRLTPSEVRNKKAVRKSYYLKNQVKKNSVIKNEDLIFKRPFLKENSKKIFDIIGKKSSKNRKIDSIL